MVRRYNLLILTSLAAITLHAAAQDTAHSNLAPELKTVPAGPSQTAVNQTDDTRTATVYKSLVPPRLASDMFGRRLSLNYIIMQVTVVNESKELDLLIHNLAVEYGRLMPQFCQNLEAGQPTTQEIAAAVAKALQDQGGRSRDKEDILRMTKRVPVPKPQPGPLASGEPGHIGVSQESCQSSSHEISLLRGVAEKGQVTDPRNVAYRTFQALATVGGGLVGAAGLGPVLPRAVAGFSGSAIPAFEKLFPDMTVNQLNRLNDSAFAANTLVGKDRSKIVTIFIPIRQFLDSKDVPGFIGNPYDYYVGINGKPGLSLLDVIVDYKHIIPVDDIDPVVTDIQMSKAEQNKLLAGKPASGQVVGRFLDGAEVSLLSDSGNPTVDRDKSQTSSDNRLFFVMTPKTATNPSASFNFQITKQKKTTSFTKAFDVLPPTPSLKSVVPAAARQDSDVDVTLTGDNFFDFDLKIVGEAPSGGAGSITARSSSIKQGEVKATLHVSADATISKDWHLRVTVAGQNTGSLPFEVTAK